MDRPRLKKALGQHHLRHAGQTRPLLEFLRVSSRRVVEIGPGGGVLTRILLDHEAAVWAWEVDLQWAAHLGGIVRDRELTVVVGDALEVPWARFPAGTLVAGNLPYNVASPLIDRVLDHPGTVDRAAFLVQWEVARRLAAEPGEADYGATSVLSQARAKVEILGRVKRGSFRPAPAVDGGFVGLTLKPPPVRAGGWKSFRELVHLAFSTRRKTLRNCLAAAWGREEADRILHRCGIGRDTRAEELGLESFLRLFKERKT